MRIYCRRCFRQPPETAPSETWRSPRDFNGHSVLLQLLWSLRWLMAFHYRPVFRCHRKNCNSDSNAQLVARCHLAATFACLSLSSISTSFLSLAIWPWFAIVSHSFWPYLNVWVRIVLFVYLWQCRCCCCCCCIWFVWRLIDWFWFSFLFFWRILRNAVLAEILLFLMVSSSWTIQLLRLIAW